jgi:hypothetical protein
MGDAGIAHRLGTVAPTAMHLAPHKCISTPTELWILEHPDRRHRLMSTYRGATQLLPSTKKSAAILPLSTSVVKEAPLFEEHLASSFSLSAFASIHYSHTLACPCRSHPSDA